MDTREYFETLEFLAQSPERVAALIVGIAGEALRFKPAPDAFSALEQVCHLRDVEREGYSRRVQRMLDEDNPLLEGIDGAQLANERDYQSQDLVEALKEFGVARGESIRLLQSASAAQRERPGHFEDAVVFTLAGLAGMMRAHDSEHLRELESLRQP